jgi:hypothetical protein
MREETRKLRVGPRTYFWRVRHTHGASGAPCTDTLRIRSDAPRSAPLFIAFTGGPGRAVGDGINPNGIVIRWMLDNDPQAEPPAVLNLHRPGVVRALLEEALARGWDGVARAELDGWTLFDAAHARCGEDEPA